MTIPKGAPTPHPSNEALLQAARDRESLRSREVLDHVALCASCSEELVHAEAFLSPAPVSRRALDERWAEFQGAPRARRWSSPVPRWALAAAAVVLVAVAVPVWRSLAPGPDAERGRPSSGAARLASPTGLLSEAPSEFVVEGAGGAPLTVTLSDAAGGYRWTSPPTSGGRVPFPEEERARLAPGDYVWTVVGGRETVPAATFRLEPRAPR